MLFRKEFLGILDQRNLYLYGLEHRFLYDNDKFDATNSYCHDTRHEMCIQGHIKSGTSQFLDCRLTTVIRSILLFSSDGFNLLSSRTVFI